MMTSRERLLAVLAHEPVDRVPISTYELCGYNSKSFENKQPSYRILMDYIREKTDSITMWDSHSNAVIAKSAYGADIQRESFDDGDYHVTKLSLTTSDRKLTTTSKYSDNVITTWTTDHWCKSIDDVDAIMKLPFVPIQFDFSDYNRVLSEIGENGIIMTSLGDPVCMAMELMEFGEATVWAITEPVHFKSTLDELHRREMINLKSMLDHQPVDLYRICGPEYATPPYLSPKHFEQYVYPYLCEMVDLIHKYNKKVRIHSHGCVGQVLDMILDTGADAIDPCEAPPDGDITLTQVKAKTGTRMTIFGNIQLKLLEHGTPEQVREAVKLCMDSAKEGGNFIIMPTASPINLPLSPKTEENYRVYIETALELGIY